MKKFLLLSVCLLVTMWAGAQTTYEFGSGTTKSTLTINGITATLNVATAGDFNSYDVSSLTLTGVTTLTITGSPSAEDYSKVATAFANRTSTTFPNGVVTTVSDYYQTTSATTTKKLVKITGAVGDFLSTALTGYASYDKLEVAGELSTADFTTLKTLTVPTIKLSAATLATGTTESAISFANNATVQNVILPKGLSAVNASMFSGCTSLNAAISFSDYTITNTSGTEESRVKLIGYVKTAGTLYNVINELHTGSSEINKDLGYINAYAYQITKIGSVVLSGNLLACDITNSSSLVNTEGHVIVTGETSYSGIVGLNNSGSITSMILTDADFANNEDMNFAKLGLGKLATVNLPLAADMTRIPESCFMNNGVLKEICIPSNYHEIGSNAFANVYTLSHVYTTGTNTKVKYDNGENTITLSENITKIETGAFANVKQFTDVYCLSTTAPKCAVDAFDGCSYYGNGGHTPTTPITRASYTNGNAFAILHYPTGTSDSEVKNYTDVDRVYSIVDETQATDGYGNTMVWPTQEQYYKAESQAYAGQTWKAWTDGVYSNGVVYTTEAAVTAAGLTSDATQKYNGTDYTGWHQFVLSAAYDYANPDKPHWNFSKIKDNQWWTICVPFDLTKSQLLTMFGDNTATDDTKYPNVCTLTKVIRDKDTKIIKLCFGENLETAATSDDAVVIQAGYPYMIKPNMLEAKDGHTYIPSNHIFAYTPSTTSTTTTLLPSYNADDNVKSTVKENGTTDAGDGFTYRFIGTYVKTLMPAHGFYLGWDTSSKSAVYYYQGNDASSKKSWNAYTCIVGAKMTATKVAQSGDFSNNTYVPAHLYITCESDLFEGNGAKVGIIFDDESTPTKINGVAFDNAAANEVTGKVYNMNGQQVRTNGSFDGLNKGVYIMNGKKYVVK
jgi:hypothetical protein